MRQDVEAQSNYFSRQFGVFYCDSLLGCGGFISPFGFGKLCRSFRQNIFYINIASNKGYLKNLAILGRLLRILSIAVVSWKDLWEKKNVHIFANHDP